MIELKLIPTFPQEIIATDEVGRGPLSGPVVVGAVRVFIEDAEALKGLLKFLRPKGIKDSKKLSAEDRVKVLKKLGIENLEFRKKNSLSLKGVEVSYVTWEMDHEIIDQENILAASLRGMKEASEFLSDSKKGSTTVLIDGHMKLRWGKKQSPFNEIPLVKGDSKSLLIGLASIIAKEKRDAFMRDMHELYPQYGFASNAGYPTSEHRNAIKEFGPSPIHRKTFKGVKEFAGLLAEKKTSLEFHETGIPLLVSPLLLRKRNLGQIDVSRLRKDKAGWIIEICEVKSSEVGVIQMEIFQKARLIAALNFLGKLFGYRTKFMREIH